jgi:hypothetical protein
MLEYLTAENLNIIKLSVQRFIDLEANEKKVTKLKQFYTEEAKKASDDTWLLSQRSTQITEIVQS